MNRLDIEDINKFYTNLLRLNRVLKSRIEENDISTLEKTIEYVQGLFKRILQKDINKSSRFLVSRDIDLDNKTNNLSFADATSFFLTNDNELTDQLTEEALTEPIIIEKLGEDLSDFFRSKPLESKGFVDFFVGVSDVLIKQNMIKELKIIYDCLWNICQYIKSSEITDDLKKDLINSITDYFPIVSDKLINNKLPVESFNVSYPTYGWYFDFVLNGDFEFTVSNVFSHKFIGSLLRAIINDEKSINGFVNRLTQVNLYHKDSERSNASIEQIVKNKICEGTIEERGAKVQALHDFENKYHYSKLKFKLLTVSDYEAWEDKFFKELEDLALKTGVTIKQDSIASKRKTNFVKQNLKLNIIGQDILYLCTLLLERKNFSSVQQIMAPSDDLFSYSNEKTTYNSILNIDLKGLFRLINLKDILALKFRGGLWLGEEATYFQYFTIVFASNIDDITEVFLSKHYENYSAVELQNEKYFFERYNTIWKEKLQLGDDQLAFSKEFEINFEDKEVNNKIELILKNIETHFERLTYNTSLEEAIKDAFKIEVLASYKRFTSIRNNIESLGYTNKKLEFKKGDNFFGVNTLIERSYFIKDWPISFINYPQNFGQWLAEIENNHIIQQLYSVIEQKIKTTYSDSLQLLNQALSKLEHIEDYIIVGIGVNFSFQVFNGNKGFVPIWDKEGYDREKDDSKLSGYEGDYHIKDTCIEVYNHYIRNFPTTILILNKNQLDILRYSIPNSTNDNQRLNLEFQDGSHIGIKLIDYAENENLAKEFIKNKPEVFPKLERTEEKLQHLKTQVWFRALEVLKVEISEEFEATAITIVKTG